MVLIRATVLSERWFRLDAVPNVQRITKSPNWSDEEETLARDPVPTQASLKPAFSRLSRGQSEDNDSSFFPFRIVVASNLEWSSPEAQVPVTNLIL